MNLVEMLADIRTELSDAATFWSDAELTRAIQKSVALMSRFIPKKAVVESTIVIDVSAESITMPAAASATAIVVATTLNGVADGDALTIADNTPDVPRRLTVTLTDANASITALTIIVKGYDKDGFYQEETWYLKDLPTGTAVQGDKYFKYISEVEVDDIAGAAAAADTLSVGTGNAYDSDVYLANRGIKWDSETVTSSPAGTNYTRDTDYRMDYLLGGIRFINGGSMAAATAYLVTYKLDSRLIDLSSLLPREDYLKIERIEYPVGNDPPTFLVPEPLGQDILLVTGEGITLTEDYHVRIRYLKPWAAPGTLSKGDYPEHLDNAIIIGSCGQALILKAEKYVQQAITEIALTNAAADAMATPLADINVALDKVTTHVTEADTALDKVGTYLETSGTTDNAKDVLANITDEIADLRTAVKTALDACATSLGTVSITALTTDLTEAATALDKVITYLETNTNENSKFWLTKITTDIASLRTAITTAIDAANAYLDEVDTTDLGQATVGAEGLLETGDDFITPINDAARVPENYADYSRARTSIATARLNAALGYVQEATLRLNNLRSYIEQAGGWGQIASGFIAEAVQRINSGTVVATGERTKIDQATTYINEAAARLDNLRTYIQEADGWMRMGDTFIAEGTQRLGQANAFVNEAIQRVNEVNAWATQADRYSVTSRQYLEIAGRYLASGQAKINEMLVMLGMKAEGGMFKSSSEQFA